VSHDHMQVEEEEVTVFVSELLGRYAFGYAGRLRCGPTIAIAFVDFPNPVSVLGPLVKACPLPVSPTNNSTANLLAGITTRIVLSILQVTRRIAHVRFRGQSRH
jgi:hypothetical protein